MHVDVLLINCGLSAEWLPRTVGPKKGEWVSATEARRLVDCINMLAVRFDSPSRFLARRGLYLIVHANPKLNYLPNCQQTSNWRTTLVSKVLSPRPRQLLFQSDCFRGGPLVLSSFRPRLYIALAEPVCVPQIGFLLCR